MYFKVYYFRVCIFKNILSFLVVYLSADIFSVIVLLMLKTDQFLRDDLITFKSCTTD